MVPTEDSDYHDRAAPQAQHLVPVVYAVVRNDRERVLLVRRADDGYGELPGGRIEVGESASAAAVRVVAEQTSVPITITGLAGVYSDPRHVVAYRTGQGFTNQWRCASTPSVTPTIPSPITRKPPPRHGLSRLR
jgi:8-oxo-dGTP pyrophosphatase MutT (NUDIX family)